MVINKYEKSPEDICLNMKDSAYCFRKEWCEYMGALSCLYSIPALTLSASLHTFSPLESNQAIFFKIHELFPWKTRWKYWKMPNLAMLKKVKKKLDPQTGSSRSAVYSKDGQHDSTQKSKGNISIPPGLQYNVYLIHVSRLNMDHNTRHVK